MSIRRALAFLVSAGLAATLALAPSALLGPARALDVTPDSPSLRARATFADGKLIVDGIQWRVFAADAGPDGKRTMVARSGDAAPAFHLPPGRYWVHAAWGLASASAPVDVPAPKELALKLDAGALRIEGKLGDATIPGDRLAVDVWAPVGLNPEGKLVVSGAKGGEILRLPVGDYHVVSTFLDVVGTGTIGAAKGQPQKTNSFVEADISAKDDSLVTVSMRHRVAKLTLKLVSHAGGAALADVTFTVLTPSGDTVRRLVGAYPSLVLAEGDYLAVAERSGEDYQREFKVVGGVDGEIEIVAK
ncbi:MAG: hypothetical protein KGI57_03585 [Hyphomicrobiales bacterium]|nr:hypothetical protein [Hyphomicrobiales bacterium]MDE2016768.1 hypothetical protein [Hyphomicrobiales bacterium]